MEIVYEKNGLQHIGIPVRDMNQTISFYQTLGFSIHLDTLNVAAGERVVFFSLGNLMLEAYEKRETTGQTGAIDHIALDVEDIEKTFSFIQEGGYELLDQEIHFLPFWENGVRYFTIIGPNKEKIEFNQRL